MGWYVGLDFGTTNSALAVASDDGRVRSVAFSEASVFRSVVHYLCLEGDDLDAALRTGLHRASVVGGSDAVRRYVEHLGEGRLIQSVKSFLASSTFHGTMICGERYTLVDLVEGLLGCMLDKAQAVLGDLGKRVVVGRPVHFVAGGRRRATGAADAIRPGPADAEIEEDRQEHADERAEKLLREALWRLGFDDVDFVYEPVAAAYHYAQELTRSATVMIADFGGGTSDFTVLRIAQRGATTVLATDGVAVAGDRFDAQLVRHLVAPALGRGSGTLGPEADAVSRAIRAEYLRQAAGHLGVRFDEKLLDFLARYLTLNLDTLEVAARRLAGVVDRNGTAVEAQPTLRLLERRHEGRVQTFEVASGIRAADARCARIDSLLAEVDPQISALANAALPPQSWPQKSTSEARPALRPSSVAEILAWARANAPELAAEVERKASPVPSWIFAKLGAWHELSMLRDSKALDVIDRNWARADAPLARSLEALHRLVAEERGFDLYQAASRTKEQLSSVDETEFVFECPPTTVRARVTRADLERWIERELREIDACAGRLLDAAGLLANEIDVVFMTGGTSMVPAVRALFERRFGSEKVRFGGEFVSVARGLALYARQKGQSKSPAAWP